MSNRLITLTGISASEKPSALTFGNTDLNREYYFETRYNNTENGRPKYHTILLDLRQLCELSEVINSEVTHAARAEARRIREIRSEICEQCEQQQ